MSYTRRNLTCAYFSVTDKMYERVASTQGVFYAKLTGVDKYKLTDDLLDPIKAENQATILQKYTNLDNKRILEIGSGLGVNLMVWANKYKTNSYGIEPDSAGFESSFSISQELADLNNFDKKRIINGVGEKLPFEDSIFDIVYSSNVLEHVENPLHVLSEALRVLKPGGIMQIIYPNYHSYFDGHYAVFHPPVFFRRFFPWYVKNLFGKDSAFAKSLRTELNVGFTKTMLKKLSKSYSFEALSLGEEIFYDRMQKLNFEAWAGMDKVKSLATVINRIGLEKLVARIVLMLKGWTPIILTLKKKSSNIKPLADPLQ